MKSAGEAEGDRPRKGTMFENSGEIVSGLFGGLPTGEEDDARKVGGDVRFESLGGFDANLVWGGSVFVIFAGNDHIGFENASTKIDLVRV